VELAQTPMQMRPLGTMCAQAHGVPKLPCRALLRAQAPPNAMPIAATRCQELVEFAQTPMQLRPMGTMRAQADSVPKLPCPPRALLRAQALPNAMPIAATWRHQELMELAQTPMQMGPLGTMGAQPHTVPKLPCRALRAQAPPNAMPIAATRCPKVVELAQTPMQIRPLGTMRAQADSVPKLP